MSNSSNETAAVDPIFTFVKPYGTGKTNAFEEIIHSVAKITLTAFP